MCQIPYSHIDLRSHVAIPLQYNTLRHFEVQVTLNDLETNFLLDTGASVTAVDYHFAMENHHEFQLIETKGGGVGNRNLDVYKGTIAKFKINELEIESQEIYYLDLSHVITALKERDNISSINGVLGADFLKTHGAIIDYNAKTLYLMKEVNRVSAENDL